MNIQDKIANNIIAQYAHILMNAKGSWSMDQLRQVELPETTSCIVKLGKNAALECEIVSTPDAQMIGLQKYTSLADTNGMLFDFTEPKRAIFHMASVQFPIDLIFIGTDNRITKIVTNIDPGTPGNWSMPHTKMVIEANGNWCKNNKINVNDLISIGKNAQEKFPKYPRRDINPLMQNTNPTHDRYRDRDLPDKVLENQPINTNFHEQIGFDPTQTDILEDSTYPTRPG